MRRRPPCRDYGGDGHSGELADRIVERGRALSALQRQLLSDVAEFDRAEAWRGTGAVSMEAWLIERCGVSSGTARVWAQAASRLESLPTLAAALEQGTLPLDKVAPLASVASPETDAELAAAAGTWTVKQLRELVQWRRGVSDSTAARRFENRSLRLNDARRTMWMAFTDDDYAEVKSNLVGRVTREERTRQDADMRRGAGEYEPYDRRLYDAHMDLFRSTAAAGGAPSRPAVILHVPLPLLTGDADGDGGVAEIQGVGPIAPEVARRLMCDAGLTVSLEAPDGSILDQGRARRDPTSAQRVEIGRRDKGCRFPGCRFTDFTQVHHMVHWTNGGRTDLDNLITLCGRHHNAVHELGWKMRGDANEVVTFTSPHGQVMKSAPSPAWRGGLPLRR